MKKKNAVRVLILFIVMIFFNLVVYGYTDSIENIEMNIYVDENGIANVEEIWYTQVASGTENFKVYGNLGKSEIYDFSVTDERGRKYQTQSNWNVNLTKEQKDYKNGINKTNSGDVELCWGLGEFGNRIYTLNYKISNFVQQYKTSQGIYFSLLSKGMTLTPKNVEVSIESFKPFTQNNTKIWGYGYDGKIIFENGKIKLQNIGEYKSSNYMVILTEILDNRYNVNVKNNKSFETIYKEAESSKNYINSTSEKDYTEIIIVIVIVSFIFIKQNIYRIKGKIKIRKNKKKAGLPEYKDIAYCREIPCDKNIFEIYYLLNSYLSYYYKEIDTNPGLFMGAIFLKWIDENKMQIVELEDDNGIAFKFDKNNEFTDKQEEEFYLFLYSISGNDKIMTEDEFSKIYEKYAEDIVNLLNKIENAQIQSVMKKYNGKLKVQNKIFKTECYIKSEEMKQEALKIIGLQKFLQDDSLMNEKEITEVQLWNEYLIIAQILNISKVVQKQLKQIYPDFDKLYKLNSIVIAKTMRISTKLYSNAKKIVDKFSSYGDNNSYSNGGTGGSSSSSGGQSASGHSSSGGGGRR